MFCTVCGQWGDLRHFLIMDNEVFCKPTVESMGIVDDELVVELEPMWFGGTTDEAGEVYGG